MLSIPNPYIMGGLLIAGFLGGYKVESWRCNSVYAEVLEKATKDKIRLEGIINTKSAQYEEASAHAADQSVVRTNTVKEIYRNISAPPANCAPPASAIGVLIESIGNSDPTTPSSQPSK